MLFSACENDINKVRELSANQVNADVDTIHGVDIIYSDSAKVRVRVLAPLLLQYHGKKPYDLMPKTVNVIIFNKIDLSQMGTLTADTGIQSDDDNKLEFHKNVVAKNAKGETFKSDELIWDKTSKTIHSDKVVQIRMANGDIMNGTGFKSDQALAHWTMTQSTGIFNVTDAPTQ
ncbi:LPS export ABC transporter periplasmic protein LptC [Mucilaginibacter sp. L196]|uniref:LPS export ABC transporter periplasmic protein LptC n=1 Tax=Mucilaginibacter sp. L196 TaxID=1641870 RepID=UPI00131DF5DF|nr:LPS export ABC transporter periplasmic protein LptC [Mucilaginibacter sp. L196]